MEKNQLNNKGEKHGYWEFYYHNFNIWTKGYYINGRRNGCWEWYRNDDLLTQMFYT